MAGYSIEYCYKSWHTHCMPIEYFNNSMLFWAIETNVHNSEMYEGNQMKFENHLENE